MTIYKVGDLMSGFHKCIFCLKESSEFNTIEHIVSESLGNTEDILANAVCDKCQNYLGKEIENFVLSKTPFGFWKTISGTQNKKGKAPFFDPSQSALTSGKIENYHSFTDNNIVIHSVDNESIIAADINDEELYKQILNGNKSSFNVVLTPKMLIYMGRFIGKIALEYWCKEFGDDVFDEKFDELRNYIRYGTTNYTWPILRWQLNYNLLIYKTINEFEEEHTLYAYSFYKDVKSNLIIFNFDIGCERYSIILNSRFPSESVFTESFLSMVCKGTKGLPDVLFYCL